MPVVLAPPVSGATIPIFISEGAVTVGAVSVVAGVVATGLSSSGAPVHPAFMVRQGDGFLTEIGPEIPFVRTGDKRKDLENNTQAYNRVIEDIVRRFPDQWFWVHQRWKTKPYCPWPRS